MSSANVSPVAEKCQCRQIILESTECPICLEQLTTNNCVLPCQHTLCRKCYEELALSNHTLKMFCPVCRQAFPKTDVKNLPHNYILNTILGRLEYMCLQSYEHNRNETSNVKKRRTNNEPIISDDDNEGKENSTAHYAFPSAKAKMDFKMSGSEYLEFKKGDIICVQKRIDKKWASGLINGKKGMFPLDHVHLNTAAEMLIKYSDHNTRSTRLLRNESLSLIEPVNITDRQNMMYKAVSDYQPKNRNELELKKGYKYVVLGESRAGWYRGQSMRTLNYGEFPANCVTKIPSNVN